MATFAGFLIWESSAMSGSSQAAGIEADRWKVFLDFATCDEMTFAGIKGVGARIV